MIPIDVGFYSLIGVKELLTEIELLKETNPDMKVSGVLVTMVERTNLSEDIDRAVREEFGPRVFKTRIRKNVRIAEAPSHMMNIFQYDPASRGAQDYENLSEEVIRWRRKKQERKGSVRAQRR
jgi:chromosome partitioning protein